MILLIYLFRVVNNKELSTKKRCKLKGLVAGTKHTIITVFSVKHKRQCFESVTVHGSNYIGIPRDAV